MKLTQRQLRKVILEALELHEQQSTNPPGPFDPDLQNSSQQLQPNVGDELEAAARQTQGTTTTAAKKKPAKKGSSKIAQLQKIIGTKDDGEWGPKSDAAWKTWLSADQHRNFMTAMKLGLDKNENMPKAAFDVALESNSASDLAQIAGYGKNLTGVLAMAKAIDAMTPDERHAAAMTVALSGEGTTVLAAKKVDQSEILDDAFNEETDKMINNTADSVNKVKNQKGRAQIIQKTVTAIKKAMEDAKKRKDQKALKRLDRKLKLFSRKTKAEKLGIDMSLGGDPVEDMQESLSRGALYRRRYYGRY